MLTIGLDVKAIEADRLEEVAALAGLRVGLALQQVNRFWAGEVEVAATFFKVPRTGEEHLHWLGYQMMKEYKWPDGRLTPLREAYSQLENGVGRHDVHALYQEAEEEFSHYVALADIAELILGSPLPPAETEKLRFEAENQALMQVRTRGSDWERATSNLHEGGGLGIYFAGKDLQPIPEDPYRTEIAEAMTLIYDDELAHFGHGFEEFVRVAIDASTETWGRALKQVELVGYHRLRMRNEQFGFPLSESRVQEIREGAIIPYLPPLPPFDEVFSSLIGAV